MSGNCTNTTPVIDGIGWYFLSSPSEENVTTYVNTLKSPPTATIAIHDTIFYYNIVDLSFAHGWSNDVSFNDSDWCTLPTVGSNLQPGIGYWIYISTYTP